jgi:hypothetical protein
MRLLVLLWLVVAACGEAADGIGPLRVDSAQPGYGPLAGGTLITLRGGGFDANDRVLINGRESPLVHAIGSTKLELVVPPGTASGEAELVVFNRTSALTAHDIFRYSTAPEITSVSPDRIVANDTYITVHGTGFRDDDAGEPLLLVDGQLADFVTVQDDTTLTFFAPEGRAFSRPQLELTNARGKATLPRAFRYIPSTNPGLLLFTRFGSSFAVFYDLVTHAKIPIPWAPTAGLQLRSVVRDEAGDYWGIEANAVRLGRLDLEAQALVAPISTELMPATALIGAELYGIRRSDWALGKVDTSTGVFTPLTGTPLGCCGSLSLAYDGSTLWFTARTSDFQAVALNTYDLATNTIGTAKLLTGLSDVRIEDMFVRDETLFGVNHDGLLQIDPDSGAVTLLSSIVEGVRAVAPYDDD